MNLQQIKNLKDQKGFTIVELLIVIVVIGILAAIIIVAYTGVQNQARTTKSKSNASTIQKRLEAYYADESAGGGAYPSGANAWKTWSDSNTKAAGSIPANISVVNGAVASSSDNVGLQWCGSDGYKLTYWDYVNGAVVDSSKAIYGGNASAASCTSPTTPTT